MHFVLLTDENDGTVLVACESMEEAQAVGNAAIFADGGVSAWLLPDKALDDTAMVKRLLKAGAQCHEVGEGVGRVRVVDIGLVD